jgi:hypothetical protein
MKKALFLLVAIVFCFAGTAMAQTPMTINLGVGGGLTMPSGDYSTGSSTGYHGLAKARFGAVMPLDITGTVAYHHVPDKVGSEAVNMIQVAVGVEYPIPATPEVKPYVGAEVAFNSMSYTLAGSSSRSREGINILAGAQFMGFDGTVKYQLLNVMGKEDQTIGGFTITEPSYNQITISVAYMFGL